MDVEVFFDHLGAADVPPNYGPLGSDIGTEPVL